MRLLVDHREDLVAERTRIISRLRWHLHELDPAWQPSARGLDRPRALNQTGARLEGQAGAVARLARELVERLRILNALVAEITTLVNKLAPSLVAICDCGPLTAAKIVGAGISRFRSNDAYARHNGTAPLPVWSSNRARHRLSRRGNRQLNAAIHRIALTQAQYHPGARELIARRRAKRRRRPRSNQSPQATPLRRRLPSTPHRRRRRPSLTQLDKGATDTPYRNIFRNSLPL